MARGIVRKSLVTVVAVTTFLSSVMGASASGVKDVFDAKYYADTYSDLKAAFGDDEEALYQHFITYGLKEGRTMSLFFDIQKYRETYADLDSAFGDNWDKYVEHYFTYGMKEGRVSGGSFDPIAYAKAYPDVYAAFGYDVDALINHYLTYGIKEGRTAGVAVEVTTSTETTTVTSNVPVVTPSGPEVEDPEEIGSFSLSLSAGDGQVTLAAQDAEEGYTFYYAKSDADITDPVLDQLISDDEDFDDVYSTFEEEATEAILEGTNGEPMYVQVIKVETETGKIKAFGEGTATPEAASVFVSVEALEEITGIMYSITLDQVLELVAAEYPTVTINIETGLESGTTTADVEWTAIAEEDTYNPTLLEEQTFDVVGTVTLPNNVINNGEEPITVTVTVTLDEVPSEFGIVAPTPVTGLTNGLSVEDMITAVNEACPTVILQTCDSGSEIIGEVTVDVTWTAVANSINTGTYDPDTTTEQTFVVSGSVNVPSGITSASEEPLPATITVTVAAQ